MNYIAIAEFVAFISATILLCIEYGWKTGVAVGLLAYYLKLAGD